MAVNKHFHTSNVAAIATEQSLYSNLVAEAIQIYGHDVFYIDRTIVAEDTVFGEDSLSVFRDAAKIEMYIENGDGGFAGEREIMNQFGLQNLSEATFVVNKIRFQELTKQITIESGTDSEEGGSILLEEGGLIQSTDADGSILINATDSSSSNSGDEFLLDGTDSNSTDAGDKIVLNATAADSYSKLEGSDFYILSETAATDSDRPEEGDTIYHPILKKMFQVNFVDHDEPFYQLDNNPVYKLRCRLFDYSSEELNTGVDSIDAIEDALTVASSEFQFTLESNTATVNAVQLEPNIGRIIHETESDELVAHEDSVMTTTAGSLISETGEYLIQESYIIGDMSSDKSAQNELFDSIDDTVLDFSETNPFGDVGSN
jgi:hypothetical protein